MSEASIAIDQKRILVIYGTRPEAIKVAPLIKELEASPLFAPLVGITGQHREMLDQVNEVFSIVPDFDLDVFAHGQGLNDLSAKIFERLDPVLVEAEPDAILVQGDTTTVMAAAVAAFYRRIPIVHLEAGLRSHDIDSPFPEEANRQIVSRIASLHLAPTAASARNLLREHIDSDAVATTGNTVIDALYQATERPGTWEDPRLEAAVFSGRRILLVTTHRRENWGGAMENVGRALRRLAEDFPDDLVVIPAHRNPLVRKAILPAVEGLPNVITTEPLPYQQFTKLLEASHIVLTDSGGVQEEAPSLGKPVLVMRENTERPEAVDAGTVKLIGTDEQRIVQEVATLKLNVEEYDHMGQAVNPYGDGLASKRCVAAIAHMLGVGEREPDFQGDSNRVSALASR